MSIERVKEYFTRYGMEDRIHEFSVSSAAVELAAQAAGSSNSRIELTSAELEKYAGTTDWVNVCKAREG